MDLMLAETEYSRDTPKLFIIKLTKFSFLNAAQRLITLRWYRSYLEGLQTYYQTARDEIIQNPQITEQERPWILQSIGYQLHRFNSELAWLDDLIGTESDGL